MGAATSCPLMRIVDVGHLPISPVVFLPPVGRLMEATGIRSFPVAVLRAGHAVAAGTAAWTGIELQRGHVVGTTNIQGCVGHWSQAFCQVVDQPRCPGWVRLCSGSGVGAAALRLAVSVESAAICVSTRWRLSWLGTACSCSAVVSGQLSSLIQRRASLLTSANVAPTDSRECSALCLSSETRDEAHPQRCPAA